MLDEFVETGNLTYVKATFIHLQKQQKNRVVICIIDKKIRNEIMHIV